MIVEVPDGYAQTCLVCGANFFSIYSASIAAGAYLLGNQEECPKCGSWVTLAELVPSGFGGSIPVGSTATKRIGEKRLTSKQLYFAIRNQDGDIVSPMWKAWVQGSDVYLTNTLSRIWKVSLHKSGHDNVAIIKDHHPKVVADIPERTILSLTRSRPFDGHFVRILCLEFLGHSTCDPLIAYADLKGKQKKDLRFNVGGEDPLQLHIVYCKGHPDEYVETFIPNRFLIGILKASRDDYIVIFVVHDENTRVKEEPNIALSIVECISGDRKMRTDFGIVLSGTFYIRQCEVHNGYDDAVLMPKI